MQTIYNKHYFDTRLAAAYEDSSLGGFWDAIGQIGAAGVSMLPMLFGGGGGSGKAKGINGITAFGQQTMQALGQIQQMLAAGQLSPSDAIANAERIAALLSNPSYVDQPSKEKNGAAVLANFKTQAANAVAQIKASAQGILDAQSAAANQSDTIGGISSNMLLMIGLGLGLLIILK